MFMILSIQVLFMKDSSYCTINFGLKRISGNRGYHSATQDLLWILIYNLKGIKKILINT